MPNTINPSGKEITFASDEIIVSKTDLKGAITYANDVFIRVSGYSEKELLGTPHNILRHPDMPKCVFKLLWDTIKNGREIFAYVINLAKNGDHYWVFAHVTPSYNLEGIPIGYHSNRRVPFPDAIPKIKSLYASLLAEERKHGDLRTGVDASTRLLVDLLNKAQLDYDQFVFSLSEHTQLASS